MTPPTWADINRWLDAGQTDAALAAAHALANDNKTALAGGAGPSTILQKALKGQLDPEAVKALARLQPIIWAREHGRPFDKKKDNQELVATMLKLELKRQDEEGDA